MRRFQVTIQRSELCSLTELVGEWEIPILQLVHGAEAVAIGNFTKDAQSYPAPAVEFERLERRYRENPATGVPRVAEVYGPSPGGIRVLFQAIKDAATEQNVPEGISGTVAMSDELNEEIPAPTGEVTEVEQGTPASPNPVVAPKASTAPTKPKAAVKSAPKKELIAKSAPAKAAVVPTPKQPTDPLGDAPVAIEE
jgi:hypothetical protein